MAIIDLHLSNCPIESTNLEDPLFGLVLKQILVKDTKIYFLEFTALNKVLSPNEKLLIFFLFLHLGTY